MDSTMEAIEGQYNRLGEEGLIIPYKYHNEYSTWRPFTNCTIVGFLPEDNNYGKYS